MEARADVRRTGIKQTAVLLILIAVGLGLMLGVFAANLGGHATTQSSVTQSAPGSVQIDRPVRSGAQVDDSGPVAPTPGVDARTIREGHGQ